MLATEIFLGCSCCIASVFYAIGAVHQLIKNHKEASVEELSWVSILTHYAASLSFVFYSIFSENCIVVGFAAGLFCLADMALITQYYPLNKEKGFERNYLPVLSLLVFVFFACMAFWSPFGPITRQIYKISCLTMGFVTGFPQIILNFKNFSTANQSPVFFYLNSLANTLLFFAVSFFMDGTGIFGLGLYFPSCASYINIAQFFLFYKGRNFYRNKTLLGLVVAITETILVFLTIQLCFDLRSTGGSMFLIILHAIVGGNLKTIQPIIKKITQKQASGILERVTSPPQTSFVTRESSVTDKLLA